MTTPDRVAFEIFDVVLEGDVVDDELDAEYGRPPERILRVDVPDRGVYRVREGDVVAPA
ncbi:hypothetical protein J2752_000435 [Halarchaeum rubridurum]|uniref:Uncharacterized protein n=1 Tax=Halarchaeum rubridurum TaxID=489911 RepID=A0A830FUT0_9EURY|nr:hypothetical protein [Halarchaeum rubridurum]MBP1953554.1 hypothetical protein [Halarchaeum rubridurum]GGM64403.1 hypothetical protein GCM10009017_13060 [Halarchaeum rubridurum]